MITRMKYFKKPSFILAGGIFGIGLQKLHAQERSFHSTAPKYGDIEVTRKEFNEILPTVAASTPSL
jgi:hypothetical protein